MSFHEYIHCVLCSSYFVHLSASIVAMTNRLNLFTLFRNNISNVLCSSRTHKHIFDGKSFKRNFSIYSRFFSLLFPFLDVIFYLRAVYQFITHTNTDSKTLPNRHDARLRCILKLLQRGDVSAEILQKNLHYAARVLEALYIDETK